MVNLWRVGFGVVSCEEVVSESGGQFSKFFQ